MSTLNDRRFPAEVCREHGWRVGSRLCGSNDYGTVVIEITGLGERVMLAKMLSYNGQPVQYDQSRSWRLSDRDWKLICP